MTEGELITKGDDVVDIKICLTPEQSLRMEAIMEYKGQSAQEAFISALESRYKSLFLVGAFDEIKDPETHELKQIRVMKSWKED